MSEQLQGVKNMALLYSFDIVRDAGPLYTVNANPVFLGDVPELDSSQKGAVSSKTDDFKILILSQRQGYDYWSLQVKTMVQYLSPGMIPEMADDIDILICLNVSQGWRDMGETIEIWGSSERVNAYDYKTGYHLTDIRDEYGNITSYLQSLEGTP